MTCMFDGGPDRGPVGTQPGEEGVLRRFTSMYFEMTGNVVGEQQDVREVWQWLTDALRDEHY
eukprot:gene17706-1836_t